MIRRLLCASVLVVVGLGASAARADDLETARARFEEGREAFRAGHYAEAAEAYERSAEAHPHPAPLVNAAEAWELDGNWVRAARACDKALALDLDGKLRPLVEGRLERLARSVGTLVLTGALSLGKRTSPESALSLSPASTHDEATAALRVTADAAPGASLSTAEASVSLASPIARSTLPSSHSQAASALRLHTSASANAPPRLPTTPD